ncbi:MAG: hypothetical protein HRU19_14045 [Pseudobacteriovorax sp.]|nr:hypothetical protein [Pseudobacteriovorax sp.]
MSNLRYLAMKSPAVYEKMRMAAYEKRIAIEKRARFRKFLIMGIGIVILAVLAVGLPLLFSNALSSMIK